MSPELWSPQQGVRRGRDDDASDSDLDAGELEPAASLPVAPAATRIQVETILGWRHAGAAAVRPAGPASATRHTGSRSWRRGDRSLTRTLLPSAVHV